MYELTTYDYLVLCFVLLVSVLIGFYHALRHKLAKYFKCYRTKVNAEDLELKESNQEGEKIREYLIASGSMSALPIAFSLLASFFSATALLGFPAEVYQYGMLIKKYKSLFV